jgi:hypothetical protein
MDIPNPSETERVWLTALEEESSKGVTNVKTMLEKGRALTPEEIVAALNYLHALDQYFARYMPTAGALSGLGYPSLAQRLEQVRQDIHQSIDVCSDMYRSAVDFRSKWETMQRDAATAATQTLYETTMHTQAVFDQMNREQMLVNEGVPYSEALLLSRLPR